MTASARLNLREVWCKQAATSQNNRTKAAVSLFFIIAISISCIAHFLCNPLNLHFLVDLARRAIWCSIVNCMDIKWKKGAARNLNLRIFAITGNDESEKCKGRPITWLPVGIGALARRSFALVTDAVLCAALFCIKCDTSCT